MKRSIRSWLSLSLQCSAVLCVGLVAYGCAGASITRAHAPNPDEPKLIVQGTVKGLAHRQHLCTITAGWQGYEAAAPVPMVAGGRLEQFNIELTNWNYTGRARGRQLEVKFMFGRKVFSRRRFAQPFSSPAVLTKKPQPVVKEIIREVLVERPAAAGNARPPAKPPKPVSRIPASWPKAQKLSTDLDSPTSWSDNDLVCNISSQGGPCFMRLVNAPSGKVKLEFDVISAGDSRNFNEVTWWRVELLDEDGLAMPQQIEGYVDVGQTAREVETWELDGSPVIFKVSSGSESGDHLRIRLSKSR